MGVATTVEVAPGIHRLGDRRVSWWLVVEDGAAVLVDAGLPAHHGQLVALLDDLNLASDAIHAVLVTHGHADHLACIPFLRRANPSVDVYIGDADRRLAATPARLDPKVVRNSWRPAALATAVAYARADVLSVRPVADTIGLADGAVLDLPGRPQFIAVPGHTPGSGMFAMADGVLFTGDALVTLDPFTGRSGPRTLPAFDNADHDQTLRSLDVIARTGATTLLPGHGEPWTGGAEDAAAAAVAASGR